MERASPPPSFSSAISKSTSFNMANSAFVNLVLVLFILRPIHAVNVQARAPFRAHGYPFSDVEFNVFEDEYSKLVDDILAIATRVPSTKIGKHMVLPRQTGPKLQPPEWILTDLAVRSVVTTIALRIDNLYLVGFTDRNGHWRTFDEYRMLIPHSTPIGFDGSYKGLGGRHNLRKLPLNRTMVVNAVQKLLHPSLHAKEELQKALATLVLVICEAARFTEISATVSSGWNSVSYISRDDILVEWAELSCELLRGWDYSRKKVRTLEKNLHFKGKDAAYSLLHVLILGKDCRNKI